MRNVATKIVEELKKHMFTNFFQKIKPLFEIMQKNLAQPDRPQMTI